jgi:RNA polymerase sigma-70 factor (ECF subfamily)
MSSKYAIIDWLRVVGVPALYSYAWNAVFCRYTEGVNPEAASSGPGVFSTTHWSVVVCAQQPDSAEADAALNQLCITYWRPVFAFIRRSCGDEETAKDLTQGFFATFLQKQYFRSASRARGRFRSFLLACVKNYLANEWDKQHTQRRGGGVVIVRIDQLVQETGGELESTSALPPDRAYERQWAYSVLGNVRTKLRLEFEHSGRTEVFDALHRYLSGDRDEAPYTAAAARLHMSVDAVKKNVERLRRRFAELLKEEIAQTVLHPSEIDDEIRFLRATLQG